MRIETNIMPQMPLHSTNQKGIDTHSNANNALYAKMDTKKDIQPQKAQNSTQNSTMDTLQNTDNTDIDEINQSNQVEPTQRETLNSQSPQSTEGENRITYGLKVLELMSDEEYQAFLWATQDLSESEKILLAQSLYRFTTFYQGKLKHTHEISRDKLNAHRAFGVEQSMIDDFIQRYKNAYDKLLHS